MSLTNNSITVEEACALKFPADQGKNYEKTEFILHSRVAEVIGNQLGRVFYDDKLNEFTINPHELQNMVITNILEEGGGDEKSTLYSQYPIYGSAIAFEPGVFTTTEGLSDGVPYPAASHECLLNDVTYCTSEATDAESLEVMDLNRNNNEETIYSPYAFRGPPDESVYDKCSLLQPDFCPSMDLSFAYDYSNTSVPEAEWYNAPRCLYLRDGETSGYWTNPYFDAGAGNINMVTYSQPIISQSGKFLGIATIDVTVDALCYGAQCVPNENSVVRWVGYSLGIIIIALALFFGGWVVLNRKHRVVRISQPIFLDIIILGVIVLASAIFPLGVNETNADERGCNIACVVTPWLVCLGFSLIFASLFSKLWRINRVFQASSAMRRVVVTERDVILPFAILMTVNFVILLSWTLVDPMVYQRVVADNSETYGRCIPQGDQWKVFISILAILNFAALVVVNVQAYKARSINDELSESKYIGLATMSMLQVRFDLQVHQFACFCLLFLLLTDIIRFSLSEFHSL